MSRSDLKRCAVCGYTRHDAPSAYPRCCGLDMKTVYQGNDGDWRPAMVAAVNARKKHTPDISMYDEQRRLTKQARRRT